MKRKIYFAYEPDNLPIYGWVRKGLYYTKDIDQDTQLICYSPHQYIVLDTLGKKLSPRVENYIKDLIEADEVKAIRFEWNYIKRDI